MKRSLVISILTEDKPGIVETLASTINNAGGNWLESRMTHLAGKFAGILQVSVDESNHEALKTALSQLSEKGISVIAADVSEQSTETSPKVMSFSLVGNDRPGIIRELSQAFASHSINMDELETDCSSMPWSGEPMFTARGTLEIPEGTNLDALMDQLDSISDNLGVDIELGDKVESISE